MQEARLLSDRLGDAGEKGNDVMLDLGLDGVDAGDVEVAALLDRLGGCLSGSARVWP